LRGTRVYDKEKDEEVRRRRRMIFGEEVVMTLIEKINADAGSQHITYKGHTALA
jgi:hypothetical protein